MKKGILIFFGVVMLLGAAYVAGHYRVLPAHYLRSAFGYVEERFGSEEEEIPRPAEGVEFLNTHLTRILMKKIPLQEYDGSGGGLSASGDFLFISSNKGNISIFETGNYSRLDAEINAVPMNLNGLIESGHTTRNSFREWWFRVNGFYSEHSGENLYTLYASHNYYDDERDCISHNVSKTELKKEGESVRQLSEWATLFAATPCFDPEPEGYVSAVPYSGHISGGAIQSYGDDHLLITVGDYNHHGLGRMPDFAPDPEIPYGKYILLNKQTGSWSVFAAGSRNPSGLFIDQAGVIWAVENGPEGGDELNIIKDGANFGWPEVSYGVWYTRGYPLSDTIAAGRHTGFEKPAFSWIPSIAPSSVLRIETDRFPLWEGDLLVGAMRGQGIRRLRLDDENRVVYDEEIYLGHRIRDMEKLQGGLLALLTDDRYLIIFDDGGPAIEDPSPEIAEKMQRLGMFDNMIAGVELREDDRSPAMVFEQRCAACHLLNRTSEIGPHLNGLPGREVGSAEDYSYSDVLRRDTRTWDAPLLRSFLTMPDAEFRGNRMNKIELSETEVDKLIQFFESQNTE